jgi:hypothetical protein
MNKVGVISLNITLPQYWGMFICFLHVRIVELFQEIWLVLVEEVRPIKFLMLKQDNLLLLVAVSWSCVWSVVDVPAGFSYDVSNIKHTLWVDLTSSNSITGSRSTRFSSFFSSKIFLVPPFVLSSLRSLSNDHRGLLAVFSWMNYCWNSLSSLFLTLRVSRMNDYHSLLHLAWFATRFCSLGCALLLVLGINAAELLRFSFRESFAHSVLWPLFPSDNLSVSTSVKIKAS